MIILENGQELENSILNELLLDLCDNEIALINKIHFQNESTYSKKISEIDSSSRVTKTEFLQGFGIAIYKENNLSEIVLRQEILEILEKNHFIENNNLTVYKNFFPVFKMILHEIGHISDFDKRKFKEFDLNPADKFRFKKVLSLYEETFRSEFQAEYYACLKILEIHSDYTIEDYKEGFKNFEELVITAKEKFHSNYDLRELADSLILIFQQNELYPFALNLGAEKALNSKNKNQNNFYKENAMWFNALENESTILENLFYDFFTSRLDDLGIKIISKEEGDQLLIK